MVRHAARWLTRKGRIQERLKQISSGLIHGTQMLIDETTNVKQDAWKFNYKMSADINSYKQTDRSS